MRKFSMQLVDHVTNVSISASGGVAYVAEAGGAAKVTLYDANGAALSNPVALTRGHIEFYTADSVSTVDLYISAPSGHFLVTKGVQSSGPNSLYIDKGRTDTVMVIPFSKDDTTAATETDTGFDVPTNGAVLPMGMSAEILTVDSGITVDLGTLSTSSGDADGFIDGISAANAGVVKATLTNGSVTLGALLKVQDSANAGDVVPEANVSMSGKSITYTLSAGADTAEGFFKIPVQLSYAAN